MGYKIINITAYGLFADNDGARDVPITDDPDGLIVGIDDRVDTGLANIFSPLSSFAAIGWRKVDSRCSSKSWGARHRTLTRTPDDRPGKRSANTVVAFRGIVQPVP
jgi:hypothetical protein